MTLPSTVRRLPLTDLQQAYQLGAEAFALGGAAQGYVQIELADPDWPRIEHALNQVVARHAMLRATFASETALDVNDVVPPYAIDVVDARGYDESALAAELARAAAATQAAFDRASWPLFRVLGTWCPGGSGRLHVAYDFAVMDSSSFEVFLGDWARFYADPAAPADPPGCDVADCLDYVRDLARMARARAYWDRRIPELPAGPRFSVPVLADESRPAKRSVQLSRAASDALRGYAASRRATPTALVLTAYGDALRLWTESPAFLVNLTVFQRPPLPDVEQVVGDFTTTMLVDVTSTAATFAERLDDVQGKVWDGLENRAVSGVVVGRELQRRRHSVEPAAPIVFTSLLGLAAEGPRLGPVVDYDSRTPQALCDLVLGERDGEYVLTLYSQDDADFGPVAAGLWTDLVRWLDDVAGAAARGDDPGAPGPSAAAVTGRPGAPAETRCGSLHAVATSLATGAAPALTELRGAVVTYDELRVRTAAVAAALAARGAGPGALVAIALPRGIEQYECAVAVARTGAAYLPVDVELPVRRQRRVVDLAAADYVVTAGPARWLDGADAEIVDLATLRSGGPAGAPPAAEPGDLAYVIYTSGSTGEPKGVAMNGGAAANTIDDLLDRFAIDATDRVLAVSALNFDLSVFDLFGLLAAGGSLTITGHGTERDPDAMLAALRDGVTIWNSVPALFELVVQRLEDTGEVLPESVRLVMLSGDVVPPTLASRARAVARRPLRVVALGGATEAGIWSNCHELDGTVPPRVPYGRPLRAQWLGVVDDLRRPRPPHCVGEIVIAGRSLADGYWRDRALTDSKFYADAAGERHYLTGDLGYVRADGIVEILGRRDAQVKLDGFRVELGEIESALLGVAGVTAAVVVRDVTGVRPLLRAFVAAPGHVTGTDLANELAADLPAYMVPKAWHVLPRLPLTANGKVDRAALTALAAEAADEASDGGPLTGTAEWLAALWRDILGVPAVAASDNFFDLGGDSLLATRLGGRLRNDHGVDVPIRSLFAAADLAEMAAVVEVAVAERDHELRADLERLSTDELELLAKELGL